MPVQHEDDVIVTRTGAVLRVTFNRPDRLNAFTIPMLDSVAATIEDSAADARVRAIVLTGAGRAFSAGADLASQGAPRGGGRPEVATIDAANRLTTAVRRVPKPVIAAVNGVAAGVGCSFAVAADLTVAKESAYFLMAFANAGLMPDGGATALLPAAVGRARAARMALLGERVSAAQAVEWGLIAASFPDEVFEGEVDRLAQRLAEGPTEAYAYTKRAINDSALAHLPHALEAEREGQSALFRTLDHAEGTAAFREKRTPRFSGV
ncbi:enoyl-CoA hydratase [Streptomyces fuscichromogenes]|uniref:Enoyl-CoA hydratase n=1 Tax=Streptomyces fuscichromogenes TaxID=1324013 RepID=A0A918CT07_9ACTN|nr:enoyl-CoA hydratase [Streptomyces fuscichromogenes]GGN19328.1 enoyl-CoA hydratase [Streptomyces fuscichromogenes]